uniref:3-keto sterol reductase n=1 Tax=Puccinia striiformis f. sp. tritici TaxID=168172 RepID=G3JX08_9BASI|nr:3-keto sterol reductase [Puccinia striiformis f. sp. tritici]
MDRFNPKPTILITGATGAVGYGISLRLLYQLSQPFQSDLSAPYHHQPQNQGQKHKDSGEDEEYQSIYGTPNGLTLLIGCRSQNKFNSTRIELENALRKLIGSESKEDREEQMYSYIDRQTGQVETMSFNEYRSHWLNNLSIDWIPLDLFNAHSVIEAVEIINHRYGYLTHLLLNAGGGPFIGIDWLALIKAFLSDFLNALTYPDYLIQSNEVKETVDKVPETWQLNVLSHYILARESLPLLAKGKKRTGCVSRMIWTGSLDGQPNFIDRQDLEGHKSTSNAYQSSKYQSELIAQGFQDIIIKHGLESSVISLLAHPGVVAGNMFLPIIGVVMDTLMRWVFYFARLILGSTDHVISGYLAGIVWTKLSLTTDQMIINSIEPRKTGTLLAKVKDHDNRLRRFGAQVDRWGNPYIALQVWDPHLKETTQRIDDQRLLIDYCDRKADALMRFWASSSS